MIRSNELLLFPTTPDVLSIVPAVQEKVDDHDWTFHPSKYDLFAFIVLPPVPPSIGHDRYVGCTGCVNGQCSIPGVSSVFAPSGGFLWISLDPQPGLFCFF